VAWVKPVISAIALAMSMTATGIALYRMLRRPWRHVLPPPPPPC
jgi:hypothetical protein